HVHLVSTRLVRYTIHMLSFFCHCSYSPLSATVQYTNSHYEQSILPRVLYRMNTPIISITKKKKRNHDVAILLILLAVLLGTFLFVTVAVNLLLRGFPIP